MSSSPRSNAPSPALDTRRATARERPGDVVDGKYRLERLAGEGGMGAVWVATNIALDTPVAIKLIRGGASRAGAVERLLREARAAAKLRHPAIVRVFDFGLTDRGQPYIVMELLDGESLRDALAREGRMSAERSVQLMLPIAEALAAAHARGVIHRDLKPDNIFLAVDDAGKVQPKVVDFGVAKVVRQGGPAASGVSVVGTPEYMAPEQALGMDSVDERADVWAFCVVLYELMVDAYLFSGPSADATLDAVLYQPARSLVEVAGIDSTLWALIERGLRKQREERWSCMRELGHALALWLLDRGVAEDVFGSSIRATWTDSARLEVLDLFTPRPTPARPARGAATPGAGGGAAAAGAAALALRGPVAGAHAHGLAPRPGAPQGARGEGRRGTGDSLAQSLDSQPAVRPRRRPASRATRHLRAMAASVAVAVVAILGWAALDGEGAPPRPPARQATERSLDGDGARAPMEPAGSDEDRGGDGRDGIESASLAPVVTARALASAAPPAAITPASSASSPPGREARAAPPAPATTVRARPPRRRERPEEVDFGF